MIKYTVLACYAIGIVALATSLPFVWYTDGFGDLRGIDGRYYGDIEYAGTAFLRMPVIAFGAAALIGALAFLCRSKFIATFSLLGIGGGAWVFIFGTLGIVHPAPMKSLTGGSTFRFASGDLRIGAYLFAAGALIIAITSIAVIIGLIRNPVTVEYDRLDDENRPYDDGSSNFWGREC